ncbi:MAG: ATP synthase F1 subunit delta [Nitrospirae bacterium]|nr:ATP synthase F1 subunit delta [Nitrospirota bacterium]
MKKSSKAIKRYTKTLFSMVEINEVEKVINDISQFYESATKVNNVKSVLVNPSFNDEDRNKLLEILADKFKFAKMSIKFLNEIIKLSAYTELPYAINILSKLYFDAKKMSKAVVTTSAQLSEQLKKSLKDTLSDKFKRTFELDCKTDPSIVGGIVVKIDSNLYDLSTRGQLRLMKEKLLKTT